MLLNFVKSGGLNLSGKTISWVEIFLRGNFPCGNYPGWEFSRWELSWVGIFRVGVILGGNFPGRNYPGVILGGSYPGWEFSLVGVFRVGTVRWKSSSWKFSGWEFSCYRWNNWKWFHTCDFKSCNAIYMKQVSSFDLTSAFEVVNSISQSSNSIDLLTIYNIWVISEKIITTATTITKKPRVRSICYNQ